MLEGNAVLLESLKKLVSDFAQAATSLTKKAASATKTNINLITEQEKQKKGRDIVGWKV